jgi:hypothetical protein
LLALDRDLDFVNVGHLELFLTFYGPYIFSFFLVFVEFLLTLLAGVLNVDGVYISSFMFFF